MGSMITVSGVAGAGKDTIVETAMPFLRSFGIEWAPSITTRDPRPGDRQGVMIHVSHEGFLTMVADGDMMEYAMVAGDSYGTPVDALDAGPNGAIKIVTVDGVLAIREWMIDHGGMDLLPIYVTVPMGDAHERLHERGWSDERIAERDSFNLSGYGHESLDLSVIPWAIISNPNGGLDAAVAMLVRRVREFLR